MIYSEFLDGLGVLEAAFGKKYSEDSYRVFWAEVGGIFSGIFKTMCRSAARSEQRLPSLGVLLSYTPEDDAKQKAQKLMSLETQQRIDGEVQLAEQERIVGNSFANFLKANNGDPIIASLYFIKAYWNAQGNHSFDAGYDRLILQQENFLADPKRAREEAKKQRRKEVAEKIDAGSAFDAQCSYGAKEK